MSPAGGPWAHVELTRSPPGDAASSSCLSLGKNQLDLPKILLSSLSFWMVVMGLWTKDLANLFLNPLMPACKMLLD